MDVKRCLTRFLRERRAQRPVEPVIAVAGLVPTCVLHARLLAVERIRVLRIGLLYGCADRAALLDDLGGGVIDLQCTAQFGIGYEGRSVGGIIVVARELTDWTALVSLHPSPLPLNCSHNIGSADMNLVRNEAAPNLSIRRPQRKAHVDWITGKVK
jgi:hypothetical protein